MAQAIQGFLSLGLTNSLNNKTDIFTGQQHLCLFDGIAYIIDPEFISDTGAPKHERGLNWKASPVRIRHSPACCDSQNADPCQTALA